MAPGRLLKKESVSERWVELALIGFIALMCVQYITISGMRYFNFDEFQVLYAGAAQLRGKTLYADSIGVHFPFFNIIMSVLIALSGFKTTTLVLARYFVLMVNGLTLFFVYRIAELIWDKRTGLLAVTLTLSGFVFLNKGIEIRHDVFNTLFVVMGGYFGLRYTRKKKYSHLILSALSFGWALASTQKAIIWSVGMIFGISLYLLGRRSYRDLLKTTPIYLAFLLIPVIICISYLTLVHHESLHAFLKRTIFNVALGYGSPKELFPFPYNKFDQMGRLIYQNALLYALGFGGVLASVIDWLRSKSEKIIIATGALFGTLFFLTAQRPFYQTFLPTVPLLAILASGMLHAIWREFRRQDLHKRAGLGVACLLLLFVWPTLVITNQKGRDRPMTSQLDNVSFCLSSLKKDEKVLCFTNNQIFFDPILGTSNEVCGQRFIEYDAICFEEKMIAEQCKVVINDYRTKLLNKEVQEKIAENYLPTKVGEILIPGFRLPARAVVSKKIWIKGNYYSPTRSLEVDGKTINGDLIHLDQRGYTFKNISNLPVYLVYVFHGRSFLDQKEMLTKGSAVVKSGIVRDR